jgi:hypothetical protein
MFPVNVVACSMKDGLARPRAPPQPPFLYIVKLSLGERSSNNWNMKEKILSAIGDLACWPSTYCSQG